MISNYPCNEQGELLSPDNPKEHEFYRFQKPQADRSSLTATVVQSNLKNDLLPDFWDPEKNYGTEEACEVSVNLSRIPDSELREHHKSKLVRMLKLGRVKHYFEPRYKILLDIQSTSLGFKLGEHAT